jgi:hypothetical protein
MQVETFTCWPAMYYDHKSFGTETQREKLSLRVALHHRHVL